MFCGLGEEGRELLTIFLQLVPATFYALGMIEGRKGFRLFVLGAVLHAAAMVIRGFEVGSIPLTEKHDNVSFMAFAMALTYIYFYKRRGLKEISIMAPPLVSLFTLLSLAYRPLNTIPPFLHSPWFYLHMFFYFVSYGFFGISACIGVFYLVTGRSEYETLQYKGNIHGWIVLSVALVTGSIWFYVAYGMYWLWTSKELWATLMWFFYGLYLHARLIKGMKGRPAAVMGVLGFAVALFTYFAIGPGKVIPSPPTQF